jgi:ribonuclease BN (tRNA processing enzyme)
MSRNMKNNVNGIEVWVLGDFGPFSRTGKSIGYKVSLCGKNYLLDCGAPIFDMLDAHEVSTIDGLIVTHCHDDHKRWFTDIALFYYYSPAVKHKLPFFATDEVGDELIKSSKPAIDRSLSIDSERMIDISFADYVDFNRLGPSPRYQIQGRSSGGKRSKLHVVGPGGESLGPDRAKIILSTKSGRARVLFKDPERLEWVEPETYYSYSSEIFYEKDKRIFEGDGYSIESIKSVVWHGIPGSAFKFRTKKDSLLFTSDTVHDIELWDRLAHEKHEPKLGDMSRDQFEDAEIIYGDINEFVERVWSPQRFEEAKDTFKNTAVFQDISVKNSVVHTDYNRIEHTMLKKKNTVLTHSPDNITAEWTLCFSEKMYRVHGKKIVEVIDNKESPLAADVTHKSSGKLFVGFKNTKGPYGLYEDDEGVLSVHANGAGKGKPKYMIDLYEDINGEYYPVIDDQNTEYRKRADGKVELVEYGPGGSTGKVVKSIREKLVKKYK